MDYGQTGSLVFMLVLMLPCLVVGLLLPIVDIRYGNTYLFGAFFDRNIYRNEHPFWFWLIEAFQIAFAFLYAARMWPLLADTLGAVCTLIGCR